MSRRALPLLLLLLAASACDARDDLNAGLQRMTSQPRADSYGTNAGFPDHRAMRPLPDGVVSMNQSLTDDRPSLDFPSPPTRAELERGRDRFDIFCAACHGRLGNGQSRVAADMSLRPPPSLLSARIKALHPGDIFRVATEGYGLMPSYRLQLSTSDRWAVVAYVRALQLRDSIPILSLPPKLQDEARRALK